MPKTLTGKSSCEGGMDSYKGFDHVRHKSRGTEKSFNPEKDDVIEIKNEGKALRRAGKK